MQTTIDFLRHGEVVGENYYRGITNDSLSRHGWKQMEQAVENRSWDHIISSPLSRCFEFAQHMHRQSNTNLDILDSWQEINFGDWEKKTAEQIPSDQLMRFYQNPMRYSPKNGEPFPEFLKRIHLAWEQIIMKHPHQHILVITHAGVIRCLFHLLLKLPVNQIFNIQVDHASLTRFHCFHDTPNFISLKFHNLTQSGLYSNSQSFEYKHSAENK